MINYNEFFLNNCLPQIDLIKTQVYMLVKMSCKTKIFSGKLNIQRKVNFHSIFYLTNKLF